MRNPVEEISISMLQNLDWTTKTTARPAFLSSNTLRFNKLNTFSFWGMSEFRAFDTRFLMRLGQGVNHIDRSKKGYEVQLKTDRLRYSEVHTFKFDFNGRYFINNFDGIYNNNIVNIINDVTESIANDPNIRESLRDSIINSIGISDNVFENNLFERDIRSDYADVKFTLENNQNIPENKQIFILGAFNDWHPTDECMMNYDYNRKIWTNTLSLKQGYYNYIYAILNDDYTWDRVSTEGSWNETENEYQVIIYYRGIGDLHDRVLGFRTFNSLSLTGF